MQRIEVRPLNEVSSDGAPYTVVDDGWTVVGGFTTEELRPTLSPNQMKRVVQPWVFIMRTEEESV